ncbi:MAG: hypothetical protein ACJ8MO_31780 [Bacillus sp. (in: firmicutes)]
MKEVALYATSFGDFSDFLAKKCKDILSIMEILIYISEKDSFISTSASFIGEKLNISAIINVLSAN